MAAEEQLRRQELDRKVEEAGLRKGMLSPCNPLCISDTDCSASSAVSDASRPRKPTSTALASVACLASSSRRIKSSSVSTVDAEDVEVATERHNRCIAATYGASHYISAKSPSLGLQHSIFN